MLLATRRVARNKKKAYLKAKIEEPETNSKIKNIRDLYRGIDDFKKGYQPRTNIVKDDKGDLVANSHSILARWRNYFSQLLNVHGVNGVRRTEIHTAEPLVSEPSACGRIGSRRGYQYGGIGMNFPTHTHTQHYFAVANSHATLSQCL